MIPLVEKHGISVKRRQTFAVEGICRTDTVRQDRYGHRAALPDLAFPHQGEMISDSK